MKSAKRGKGSLKVEVVHISRHGLWILMSDHEYLLPYLDFPWFISATIDQIYNVQLIRGKYLRWPDLDVDLEIASIIFPEKYPLKYIA